MECLVMAPKKKIKRTCLAEAQKFAESINLVMSSGKLLDLMDAFEDGDTAKFAQLLDAIPGIDSGIKDKMNKGAHTKTTVSFNWY